MRRIVICWMVLGFSFAGWAQKTTGFQIIEKPFEKQADILYKGRLLTAYAWYDSSRKPVLFPVNTVGGITVTRSYPFKNVPGERTDHPHHTGIWLNYESVNGLDFWNNSTDIPPAKRHLYGTIEHRGIRSKSVAGNKASLLTEAVWRRPDGKVLLNEETQHLFRVAGNTFLIDRVTTLTASDTAVVFKDVKDGMIAIRVARELEMPSKEAANFVDDKGNITNVARSDNATVTGMYVASNGLTGDAVWSSQGPWAMLTGSKDGKELTVGMIDHPSNVGYPTYWHARGYGLFAANPLGRKIFSNGKEALNFTLKPGEKTTFRYRIVIHEGAKLTAAAMNAFATAFAR